jgi:biopolymer transport protein ExbD
LGTALDAATKGNRDERLYLRADRKVDYGDLMEVINSLRDAGYTKVALVGMDGGK